MSSTTLQTSKTSAFCRSTWTGRYNISGITYSTPTTASDTITVTVPATLAGATFTSATVSYNTLITKAGTRAVRFEDTYELVTNTSMLQRLQNGDTSIGIRFTFTASGGSGGYGNFTADASWSNFSVTVTYTDVNGITGTVTVTSGGTATYSMDTPSLAAGETAVLSIYAQPTAAITGIIVGLRPGTLSAGQMTFSATRSIASGSSGSFSFTVALTPDVVAVMTNRVYSAQLQVTFLTTGGNYSSSWISAVNDDDDKPFKLVKTRTAPVISGVTWGENGTTHITRFGNPVQGKTLPILSFSVALDNSADASISIGSREISIDGKTYAPGDNSCAVSAISVSGSVAFSITVTDSYGLSGSYSGQVTVLAYTAPRITGVDITRYAISLDSGGHTVYELDDDGNRLWFDGDITVQTTLGSGTNPWTLKITPSGGSEITAISGSTSASVSYVHERSFLSDSYDNTAALDFTVTLSDLLTTRTYEVNVPKAGGYLNIEKTGVAVGMRSTGTEEEKLFECNYPARFYSGVEITLNGSRYKIVIDETGISTGNEGEITFVL